MKIVILQRRGIVDEGDFKKQLDTAVREMTGDLSATATFSSFTNQGWAMLSVEGEDAEVLVELLSRRFGLAEVEASKVEVHGNYRGVVKNVSTSGIVVDVGIERPKPTFINIKLTSLQAQLADGQKTSCRRIAECYCITPETPVSVRVTLISQDGIEGWLSDSQIDRFYRWMSSGLERIQAFSCLPNQLEFAIRKAQLERDIAGVEQLSLTVQSTLCKYGTNAVGLIPRLGSVLRKSELQPFIPKRIQGECRAWLINDV